MIIDTALMFALGAAFSYAVADMGARYGVIHAHPFVGSTFSRIVSLTALMIFVFIMGAEFPPLGWHYLWVMAGGACTPGLFAILFMFGISKIGVSRAAPIKGSSPIFGSILAIIFLGERPEWHHMVGVVLVVSGIAIISSGSSQGKWRRIHVLWPIAAAVIAGMGAVFWRMGLPAFPDAIAGAAVGMFAALMLVAACAVLFVRDQIQEGFRNAWAPFLIMGLAAACGSFFYANALQRGEVYRMTSLIQTSPLFTVLFALILLRQVENITWRVPAGALLTVSGALLVNLRLG